MNIELETEVVKVKSYHIDPLGIDNDTVQSILDLSQDGYNHSLCVKYYGDDAAQFILATADLEELSDEDMDLISTRIRDLHMQETEERDLVLSTGQVLYMDIDV